MGKGFNKLRFCIFIILFVSLIPSLVEAKTADEWLYEGIDLGHAGKYAEAIKAFDEALKINPKYGEAWYNKGVVLGNLERCDEALKAYNEALKINPQRADAWNNKGRALFCIGRDEEALKAFDEALKINPEYGEAWYNKARVLDYLKRYDEAYIAYDKSLEKTPWFFQIISDIIGIIIIKIFMPILDLGVVGIVIFIIIGLVVLKKIINGIITLAYILISFTTVYAKGEPIFSKPLVFNYNNNYEIMKTIYESSKKRYENWLKWIFIPAIALGILNYSGIFILPEFIAGILILIFKVAFIYITIWYGLKIGMKKHWSYILGFSTLFPFMWIISIVYLLSRKKQYNAFVDALKSRGNALDNHGMYEKALTCYDRVLEINPKDEETLVNKGIVLGNLGKHEEALICYDKALKINPTADDIWFNKACSESKLNNKTKAIEYLQRAIELNIKNKESAIEDKDFDNIRNDAGFIELVNSS